MKVFLVNKHDWLGKGPMSNVTTQFAHALAEEGADTTLLMSGDPKIDPEATLEKYFHLPRNPNLKIITLSRNRRGRFGSSFGFYLACIRHIIRSRSRGEPAVVFSRNSTFLPYLAYLRSRGMISVFETHGYHGCVKLPGLPRPEHRDRRWSSSTQYHWLERNFMNRISGAVFIAEPQERLYKADFFHNSSVVLPLGSRIPQGSELRDGNHFRRRRLVYSGRMTSHIDADVLLNALRKTMVPVRLLYLGLTKDQINQMKIRIQQLDLADSVDLEHWLSPLEMHGHLELASAGLAIYRNTFRSAAVTSPTKIFDYFSAGLPVIAPDIASIRSVVKHGENGLLYEPGSPGSLARAIDELFSDSSRYIRMSRHSLLSAYTYSWKNRSRLFLNFIEGLDAFPSQLGLRCAD